MRRRFGYDYDEVSRLLRESKRLINRISKKRLFEDEDFVDDSDKDSNVEDAKKSYGKLSNKSVFRAKKNEIISRLALLRDYLDEYAVFLDDVRLKFLNKIRHEFKGKDLKNLDPDDSIIFRKRLWDMIGIHNKMRDKTDVSYAVKMEVFGNKDTNYGMLGDIMSAIGIKSMPSAKRMKRGTPASELPGEAILDKFFRLFDHMVVYILDVEDNLNSFISFLKKIESIEELDDRKDEFIEFLDTYNLFNFLYAVLVALNRDMQTLDEVTRVVLVGEKDDSQKSEYKEASEFGDIESPLPIYSKKNYEKDKEILALADYI